MKMISSDWNSDQISYQDRQLLQQIQEGRSAAITWMAGARRSSGRVMDRLKQIGYPYDVINSVIESLKMDGTIDDERLARGVVRRCQGRKAESSRAMANRMTRLGIEESAIRSVLSDQTDDLTAAIALIEARLGSCLQPGDSESDSTDSSRKPLVLKAFRLLAGRGFDRSTIFKALASCGLRIDMDS